MSCASTQQSGINNCGKTFALQGHAADQNSICSAVRGFLFANCLLSENCRSRLFLVLLLRKPEFKQIRVCVADRPIEGPD